MEGNNQKLIFNTPSKLNVLKLLLPASALCIAMCSAIYVKDEKKTDSDPISVRPALDKSAVDKMIAEHSRRIDITLNRADTDKAITAIRELQPVRVPKDNTSSTSDHSDELLKPDELDELEDLKKLLLEESVTDETATVISSNTREEKRSEQQSDYEKALQAPTRVNFTDSDENTVAGNTDLSRISAPSTGHTAGTLSEYDCLGQNSTDNPHGIMTPKNEFYLRQGSVIPAVLLTGINSELPGQISAQVTTDVYDSIKGNRLLIPAGTMIVGQYSSTVSMGQERVMAAFTRLMFPDGRSLNIGAMPGQASDGFSGFDAQIDNHYLKNLYNSMLVGLFSARPSAPNSPDYGKQVAGEIENRAGDTSAQTLQSNINLAPTLKVSPGTLFNIAVTKDLYFKETE